MLYRLVPLIWPPLHKLDIVVFLILVLFCYSDVFFPFDLFLLNITTYDTTYNAKKITVLSQTTNATLWTLYCLGNNPDVQETFFNEINRVLPNGEEITPEKLKELPYVKAILKETLR